MSRTLHLYLFVDALGWELVDRYRFCADFLTYRRRVETQLGYSAGAVPTILSGAPPPEHGHFSFFYYDPEHSPFRWMRFLPGWLFPDAIFGRHRVRHHLSKWLKRLLGYTGYFELYRVPFRRLAKLNYSEKCDMFVPGGLAPVPNLADRWQGKRYHISNWRRPGSWNMTEAEDLLRAGEIEYAFIYNAELDGYLHLHIGEPAAVEAELARYEKRIRTLYDLAVEHYDSVEFCVFSDHGMTPLLGTVDLRAVLRPYRWGTDYVSFLDATMGRFWWPGPAHREEIMAAVAKQGHGHWMTEAETKRFRLDFPGNRYGDAIYLLDPGWQFAPSDMGASALPGMHGFSPEDKDSDACFLCNHRPEIEPHWIGDFFTVMTRDCPPLRN